MENSYKTLQSDMDFLTAALTRVRVSVWNVQDDREALMDYGGLIEEYSPLSIKIMGGRYFRNMYEFRVKRGT